MNPDKESVHEFMDKIHEVVSADKGARNNIREVNEIDDDPQFSSKFKELTYTLSIIKLRDIQEIYTIETRT